MSTFVKVEMRYDICCLLPYFKSLPLLKGLKGSVHKLWICREWFIKFGDNNQFPKWGNNLFWHLLRWSYMSLIYLVKSPLFLNGPNETTMRLSSKGLISRKWIILLITKADVHDGSIFVSLWCWNTAIVYNVFLWLPIPYNF